METQGLFKPENGNPGRFLEENAFILDI